jgi:hypothetical protein
LLDHGCFGELMSGLCGVAAQNFIALLLGGSVQLLKEMGEHDGKAVGDENRRYRCCATRLKLGWSVTIQALQAEGQATFPEVAKPSTNNIGILLLGWNFVAVIDDNIVYLSLDTSQKLPKRPC